MTSNHADNADIANAGNAGNDADAARIAVAIAQIFADADAGRRAGYLVESAEEGIKGREGGREGGLREGGRGGRGGRKREGECSNNYLATVQINIATTFCDILMLDL